MLALLTVITPRLSTCKQIPGQLQISHLRGGDPLIVRISLLSALFSSDLVTRSHCVVNISLLMWSITSLCLHSRLCQDWARPGTRQSSDQGAPWTMACVRPGSLGPHMTIHREGEMNEKCNTTLSVTTRLSCIRYFSSAVIVFVFAPRHLVFLPLLKVSEPMSSQKKTNECRQILICKGMPGLGLAMWCRCVSFSSWIILTGFSK